MIKSNAGSSSGMFASGLNIRLRSLANCDQLWPPPINTDPDNINNSGEFVCCGDISVSCGLSFLIKAARKTSVKTNGRVWEPLAPCVDVGPHQGSVVLGLGTLERLSS